MGAITSQTCHVPPLNGHREAYEVCPASFSNLDLSPWKISPLLFAKAINRVYAVVAALKQQISN